MTRNIRPKALVTGAGRRLGRHIALALARNGFDVAVHYHQSADGARETVRNLSSLGGRSFSVKADIGKKQDVTRLVRRVVEKFGHIDLLVNNAGVFSEGTILTTSEDVFDTTMNINLKGMFLCSQAVARHMVKRRKGTIINITSLGGVQPWSKHLPYSVSKAGAIMLTKLMARSLAPDISVNAIAPGTIIIKGEEDPEISHVGLKKIPLRKYGTPEDITSLVLYLATTARYITGQIFAVDGGRSTNF